MSDIVDEKRGAAESQAAVSITRATPQEPLDLGKVRELILAANPSVVAELVQGDSFDALLASVEPARAAYARIAEAMQPAQQAALAAAAGSVPAGQPERTFVINVAELSPFAKIAEGLKAQARQ